jgi:hypothetical protein
LTNGLLKHLRCNQQRGDRRANGCDRLWSEVVKARMSTRPRSFMHLFRGAKPVRVAAS